MRVVEKVGRTIDEAIQEALKQLGATRQDVDIEVLEEGSKGLFGLLGARRARVRVELKPGVEPASADVADELPGETADPSDETEEVPLAAPASQQLTPEDKAVVEQKLTTAEQFLTGVLERMGVEAALETRMDEDDIFVINIAGDDLGLIIGRRGQTLDALQFLVNQVANKSGGVWVRIVLDAQGYRERRAEALAALARRMANKARRERRRVVLEPMNALERRIVHLTLVEEKGVETFSEGEDPHRRVVIAPKQG